MKLLINENNKKPSTTYSAIAACLCSLPSLPHPSFFCKYGVLSHGLKVALHQCFVDAIKPFVTTAVMTFEVHYTCFWGRRSHGLHITFNIPFVISRKNLVVCFIFTSLHMVFFLPPICSCCVSDFLSLIFMPHSS